MRAYSFLQVDAFTERPLAGNPCAILRVRVGGMAVTVLTGALTIL